MKLKYNTNFPGIEDLIKEAKRKIPRFAFEYLDGGCNEDVNLYKNTADIREIELKPFYLTRHTTSDTKTELFGHIYDAPFVLLRWDYRALCGQRLRRFLQKQLLSTIFHSF